jgi:hypothetical protein
MRRTAINVLAFTGGFAIMALELLGGRMLAPYFGSSVHVWGSLITVFMLSLAAGYLLGGRWSLHAPSFERFAAIFVAGAILLAPLVPLTDPALAWVFERVEDPRWGSLLAASTLFVVPTVVLGTISPYSVRLLVEETRHSGHVAGTLYFVSTLGSALGTLATSFYFVLWFEIDTIILLLAGALLAFGMVALAMGRLLEPSPA